MSEICLDTVTLFDAVTHIPHALRGDTLIVFLTQSLDVWQWIESAGSWCMIKRDT